MSGYELYPNAGCIPYQEWRESGVRMLVFDKDGTLTSANELEVVDEVAQGFSEQRLSEIFPIVSIVSNNRSGDHVQEFARSLEEDFGFEEVYAISRTDGFARKPSYEMGRIVAETFGIATSDLGIIGDRRLADTQFGLRLHAARNALCQKVGIGDVPWVPTLRRIERVIVGVEKCLRRARVVEL